ncbi:hypothetical protein [Actinomadura roseirufa]|uniref:hypothetical protein n=1 Tax=Actinomadura roseirufa TaxID=2094049 RepID=UPI001040F0C7|nr:hypothetical protein [Actinomadura roseirufa]
MTAGGLTLTALAWNLETASWVAGCLGAVVAVVFGLLPLLPSGGSPMPTPMLRRQRVIAGGTVGITVLVAAALVGFDVDLSADPKPTSTPSSTWEPSASPPTREASPPRPSGGTSTSEAKGETDGPPIREPGPGFRDTGCAYEVTNDSAKGAQPYQITRVGGVDQPFRPSKHYLWSIAVVIGHRDEEHPEDVTLGIFNGKDTVFQKSTPITNNATTEIRFSPQRVVPGKTYTVRVINSSGITLGVYMAPRRVAEHAERLGQAEVHGQERLADGPRPDVLTGCVGEAERI